VLVDSEILALEVELAALAELGVRADLDDYMARCLGLTGSAWYAQVERDYFAMHNRPLPGEFRSTCEQGYRAAMASDRLVEVSGARAFVAKLACPKAVASSSSIRSLENKLRRTGMWDHFAPHVYSGEQVQRGKPEPDLFLHAAKSLGIDPERLGPSNGCRGWKRQMKLFRMYFAVAALSLCIVPAAYARLVGLVSYQELFDKSDLIVIASPVTKTTDTEERTYFPNISEIDKDGKQSSVAAVGVETSFNVSLVIKGDRAAKLFILHHYREANGPGLDGPAVVSFDPSDYRRRRDILLFLIKERDGRYAPYGGQTDPGLQAITALEPPP